MTDEQWSAAWLLCETAGELDAQTQLEYVRSATADPEVEGSVIAVFEDLKSDSSCPLLPDRQVGDTIGRYLLTGFLGRGGMGEVYSAEDLELRRPVALKFLSGSHGADVAAASQMISEARLASRLNHPNIVTVYELIQTQWGLAMVMELAEGQSLRKLFQTSRLPRRKLIHIGRQLASALAAAHGKGVVHRDIKPENVIVQGDHSAKLLDFGLAQNAREQTAGGSANPLAGTMSYMAPEQKKGRAATSASDIYSLALLLVEAGFENHPILAQMLSTEPDRRPEAAEVERTLARLEAPSHRRWIGLLLFSVLLLAVALYWRRSAKAPVNFTLVQVTKYVSNHDVRASAVSNSCNLLAYATADGGFFLRQNDGGSVRELTGPLHLTCYQLLFVGDDRLFAVGWKNERFEAWNVSLVSKPPWLVSQDVQLAASSHDGKQIAWLDGAHHVWVGTSFDVRTSLPLDLAEGKHVAGIFWSGDDKRLWVQRVWGCRAISSSDATTDPETCASSDLVSSAIAAGNHLSLPLALRPSSGLFTSSGEFIFLRQDFRNRSEGLNVWSVLIHSNTGKMASPPKQISHFSHMVLSQVAGPANGKKIFVVRTDSATQTYTSDWQAKPAPLLSSPRRLTLEQSNSFPHAWSADDQSVIFESDRGGHLEIFRQNLKQREPELLASSTRESYFPQLTPDGKWILFMSAGTIRDGDSTDLRLMRIPASGGAAVQVPIGGPLDEFRCGHFGQAQGCVLRVSRNAEQSYYALDPLTGRGRELGRTKAWSFGLGRWALSADGHHVAIPDQDHLGRFVELQLDPQTSNRREIFRQISGMHSLAGMNPGPAGEWLAWSNFGDRTLTPLTFPPLFLDNSLFSDLYFIDGHLQAHLLKNDSLHAFGVFSNDGRHIATIQDEITSNVWSFDR